MVTGARQVGKTYLIREFGRDEYDVFLEINFIETPKAKEIFEGDLDASTLVAGLTAFTDVPLVPGKTLVFLDEIQECPRARTAMKFLVEDGRFDYVESGSLLGVAYKEVPSYPVGYEQHLRMYPLTLQEFFEAIGQNLQTLDLVRDCLARRKPVPEAIHQRLLRAFALYMVVGGMPAAVARFAETSDLSQVREVQQDIVELYRQDISKYGANKPHIKMIFDAIPEELDKKNKRFKLTDLAKTARMERYVSDFMWLADAGVGLPCYNVKAPDLPLALNAQRSLFKLFLCDVGLLSAQASGNARFDLLQGDLSINWGSALENAVAQELTAHGFALRYFDKAKYGEVDFIIEKDSAVMPVEAKSGKDWKKHKALDNVMAVKEWGLDKAVVLCQGNVCESGGVVYLPWYAMMFLEEEAGAEDRPGRVFGLANACGKALAPLSPTYSKLVAAVTNAGDNVALHDRCVIVTSVVEKTRCGASTSWTSAWSICTQWGRAASAIYCGIFVLRQIPAILP